MDINVKIQEAEKQIYNSLAGLPISICYLLLRGITSEVQFQYRNYKPKEEKQNEQGKDD